MFPNDLWLAEPNYGKLYKLTNDTIALEIDTLPDASAVLVSQDMIHIYTVHKNSGTVVRYRDGARVADIKVGKDPVAICEDNKHNIYVANYADNTVSKIINGRVVKTIAVSNGPKALVCDSRNNVYVCSYLTDSVDIITGDIVVDTVKVFHGPRAVLCDPYDNIWVANYGSNTVAKINYSKVEKIDLSLDLGNEIQGPIALTSDLNGTIYVAGYLGNNVGIIRDGYLQKIISVADCPTAISVNDKDEIYVTSEIDGSITKIAKEKVVASIPVCANPIGFADFTGRATYNVFNYTAQGGNSMPVNGWTMEYLDPEIQLLLNKIESGFVGSSAEIVQYNSTDYPTVKDALDKLLNVSPVINSFKLMKDTYEHGQEVTSVAFTWAFNKPMSSVKIKLNGAEIFDVRGNSEEAVDTVGSATINDISITSPSTLILEARDESGLVDVASVRINFEHRFLYGAIDQALDTIDQNVLNTLRKSPIVENPYGKYFRIDCGYDYDKIPIIAVPSSWNLDSTKLVLVNGYVNNWEVSQVTYTNASGGSSVYDVFKFGDVAAGELLLSFLDVL